MTKLKKFIKLISYLLVISFIATGCASYNAANLDSLIVIENHNTLASPNVAVAAKQLTRKESEHYLGRNVIAQGYLPIQLTIANRSNHPMIFSVNRLSLELAHPQDVARSVHTSTAGRAVGYGAASILVCPLFLIPALYESLCSADANQELDDDFLYKAAKDQRIAPHTNTNMVLFVPQNHFKRQFNMALVNADTNQIQPYQVDIA